MLQKLTIKIKVIIIGPSYNVLFGVICLYGLSKMRRVFCPRSSSPTVDLVDDLAETQR